MQDYYCLAPSWVFYLFSFSDVSWLKAINDRRQMSKCAQRRHRKRPTASIRWTALQSDVVKYVWSTKSKPTSDWNVAVCLNDEKCRNGIYDLWMTAGTEIGGQQLNLTRAKQGWSETKKRTFHSLNIWNDPAPSLVLCTFCTCLFWLLKAEQLKHSHLFLFSGVTH